MSNKNIIYFQNVNNNTYNNIVIIYIIYIYRAKYWALYFSTLAYLNTSS